MSKLVATVISRVFDPFLSLGVLFILLFYNTSIFIPALLLMIVLPLTLFIVAWKTKVVSNWDVSDRRQRPKILWALIAIVGVSGILLGTTIEVPVLVAIVGFAIITHFWKISGHAMAIALTTGFIVARFGWSLWPVLLLVPLVSWARVVRRDHTIWQVTAGALYSWVLVYLFSS